MTVGGEGDAGGTGEAWRGRHRPPKLAEAILRLSLPSRYRDQQQGDLREAFCATVDRTSVADARSWYRRQVLTSVVPNIRLKLRTPILPRIRSHRRRAAVGWIVAEDIRFAFRTLRKRPLFTAVSVMTVGLGIGGTTAIFSTVEELLLRSLPYERPNELVTVLETFPMWRSDASLAEGWDRVTLDYPNYERWRDQQSFFQEVAAFGSTRLTLSGLGEPELIQVGTASSSLHRVLGLQPEFGRWFLDDEDGRDGARVAIISHTCWQDRFGADTGILEKTVTLNGLEFQIVGVLPLSFYLRRVGYGADPSDPGRPLVWIPIGVINGSLREGNHLYDGIGRLRPGREVAQAIEQTASLIRGEMEASERGAQLLSMEERRELEIGQFRAPLLLLMAASLLLLLIACANVAMLSVAEAAGRRREMLTRTALGARPLRLIRQLLTESVLVGVLGSLVGLVVAFGSSSLLPIVGPRFPWMQDVNVNGKVLLFASSLGVFTGLLFGIAPSIGLPKERLNEMLRQSGHGRLQGLVVSTEIALTVVLLVSGGLLARSFFGLLSVDTGFRQENLAEIRVQLSRYRFADAETRTQTFLDICDAVAAVPGVSQVSGTSGLPFSGSGWLNSIEIEGRETDDAPHVNVRQVLPDFFELMEIPLISGRTFFGDEHSVRPSQSVVVSETMARRFWPQTHPVGRRVRFEDRWSVVVGVVGDVRHESLTSAFSPTVYVPVRGVTTSLVVRTSLDPHQLLPHIRAAVRSVDPGAPILRTTTVSSLIAESAAHERFRTVLLMAFAAFAVLLGAAGVFGVTARAVSRRTKELGIRMALGAYGQELTRETVRRSLSAGLLGIALGLPIAYATAVLLSPLLFGVDHWDPVAYGAATALMVGVCWLASYVPARRIAALDPVRVLNHE